MPVTISTRILNTVLVLIFVLLLHLLSADSQTRNMAAYCKTYAHKTHKL
jgi:hypothetical protein